MESVKAIIRGSETETKFTAKDWKFIGKSMYFLQLLWNFVPARDTFLYSGTENSNPEHFKFINIHDIIDHIGVGMMSKAYDITTSQHEIKLDLDCQLATDFFLQEYYRLHDYEESFYNRNLVNFKNSFNSNSFKIRLTQVWDIMLKNPKYKAFLPYYDAMTDQEVFDLFKLVYFSTENTEEKVKDYLVQFEPRVRKMWIFNYLIRLNGYEYMETWLNSLLAGTGKMPEIPELILERNAELNSALNGDDSGDILSDLRNDEYKAKMIAKIAVLEVKLTEFINRIAPTDTDKASFLKYFQKLEQTKTANSKFQETAGYNLPRSFK